MAFWEGEVKSFALKRRDHFKDRLVNQIPVQEGAEECCPPARSPLVTSLAQIFSAKLRASRVDPRDSYLKQRYCRLQSPQF